MSNKIENPVVIGGMQCGNIRRLTASTLYSTAMVAGAVYTASL
ncbi:hypothetical protein SEN34_34 [Salmonella phage SEN34]|uniref:Uncharacterized protein n=1 Tax=Salmonella phage SEN34 TaxID=1647463 RepID=A0A0M5M1K9_9CAUD|nr:hypothetical protein SEN34_34 [Salmonella phage SEN34]ALF02509.1 hypothetical protein SEN34_34 [Salmonella phage SEN34]